MEKRKVIRTYDVPTTLRGEPLLAAECCEIDYGKQGVSRAYVVMTPPLPEEEKRRKQKRIDEIVNQMWLSVQESRRKKAEGERQT